MNPSESRRAAPRTNLMRLLVLLMVALGCLMVALYVNYDGLVTLIMPLPENAPSPVAQEFPVVAVDVDAMASRMTDNRSYYEKLRDQGLSLYDKNHPDKKPYDDDAKSVIRLAAYYMTWGDAYGEGVFQHMCAIEQEAAAHGCNDPLVKNLETCAFFQNHYPTEDSNAARISHDMLKATDEPVAFQLWEGAIAVKSTLSCNENNKTLKSNTPSMQLLPKVIDSWRKSLSVALKDNAPRPTVYYSPYWMENWCESDEDTLNIVHSQIDQAFKDDDIDNGLKMTLDGSYLVCYGWAARGSGYANTVSEQQSNLFDEREAQAETLLETGYTKYPDESKISNLMITVSMARGLGKDTMEMWFQRAIKADSNDYRAYFNKAYFLQPRWYGSPDEVFQFGKECVATQKWEYRIPMILTDNLGMVAQNGDADIFTRDEVWKVVESTYREYLKRYPQSITYRTHFLQDAYRGHHKDIVLEQFKILGNDWDQDVLSGQDYQDIKNYLAR